MSSPLDPIHTTPGRTVPNLGKNYVAHLLCDDAYEAIEKAHGKTSHRIWASFSGSVRDIFRYSKKETLAGIAVSIVIVAVTVGVGVATAGAGTAVIIGIAAGSYAVSKAGEGSTSKFFGLGRRNRKWLASHQKAHSVKEKDWAKALTIDAADAIRRAVDHYRKSKDAVEALTLKLGAAQINAKKPGVGLRCPDAVNVVLATTQFIHEADKTRNYILPCIDLSLLLLNEYLTIAQKWNAVYKTYEGAIAAHCHHGYHEECKDVCYQPTLVGGRQPTKRLKGASTVVASGSDIYEESEQVKLTDMIRYLMKLGVAFEKALGDPHLPTYPEGGSLGTGVNQRFHQLYDNAIDKYDSPGFFVRVGHSANNYYTRTTASEKAFAAVIEAVGLVAAGGGAAASATVGMVATPLLNVLGSEITVGQVAKGGIQGGIFALKQGATIGCNVGKLSLGTDSAIQSDMLSRRNYTTTELKHTGMKTQDLFKRACNHFHTAHDAMETLEKAHGGEIKIVSCDAAMGMAQKMYEFVHHFDKMGNYLWACLGLIAFIGEDILIWTDYEGKLWVAVESVAKLAIAGDHEGCLKDGTVCYGPKQTKHRHFRGPSTFTADTNQAHNTL